MIVRVDPIGLPESPFRVPLTLVSSFSQWENPFCIPLGSEVSWGGLPPGLKGVGISSQRSLGTTQGRVSVVEGGNFSA